MLIDCHTHLANYNEEEISEIILRAQNSDISYIFTAGTDVRNSEKTINIANNNNEIYCGVGIHPSRVTANIQENDLYELEQLAQSSNKVIMMSENGMDYMTNSPDIKIQEKVFIAQITIAKKLKLPIIWHSQIPEINSFGNHKITLDILNKEQAYTVGGIMHYFQADYTTAKKAIESGFLISFAKPLLRQRHQKEIIEKIPLEHMVIETDSSPQPWKENRSLWTEPKDTLLIAKKIAEIKNISLDTVINATTSNLNQLFNNRFIEY